MTEPSKSNYAKAMAKLFEGSRARKYPKNQLVHYQGDPLSHIYLLQSGYIKAYMILDSGDTRTILLLGPGDVFPLAFSATMDWGNYAIRYFYQSLVETELLVLPIDTLREHINSDPQMMSAYMNYMAASNQTIMDQLEVMKNKKAIDKVAMMLPGLANKAGRRLRPGLYELQLKLSHQEIADLCGVTRETTTTLVKQLEKEKIIKQQHGRWQINLNNLKKFKGSH